MPNRGAEGAEDFGEGCLDDLGELVFGAAGGIGKGRKGYGKGAGGEIGRGRPAIGDGEQDGALDEKLERLALSWLAVGDADAAGEAAEGVGDRARESRDVVEGEDPVQASEGEELARADLPAAPTATVFTAIRDSLGLRLEPRKEQVEMLVIDHVERVPIEN